MEKQLYQVLGVGVDVLAEGWGGQRRVLEQGLGKDLGNHGWFYWILLCIISFNL